MESKHPQDSKTTMTDSVLPSETNAIHTLFGGELLARMDRAVVGLRLDRLVEVNFSSKSNQSATLISRV